MDKLRRALSGNDVEDEESGFVAQVELLLNVIISNMLLIATPTTLLIS